ncbi:MULTISPECIES: CrcB family protein [Aurantimicrobium]|uniref:fluoride efflux transporter FluC n=1 Tax=Aurantimicrobium TaxID=1705353 RepID=UPI000DED8B4F|nr:MULTISPECIES: CrcB family protein [Aurantimicrobium]AXE55184.1 camphor resistance protein CrcB [Aurantimicrobium sp. MWH-Uga1]MDH6238728.1 CrcB protein [Aurantimicrobium minutum]
MKDLKKDLLPVIIGGALGTALRILLDIILSLVFATFSLGSTMLINAVGSFVLGFLVAGLWAKPKTPRWFKVGIGPGVLGGFTTFSGVMLQALLIQNPMMTAAFLALSIATSLFAAVLGIWLGTPRKKGARR